MRLGFIGAGNMASAMMKSVLDAGVCAPSDIICSDVVDAALEKASSLGVRTTKDNAAVVKDSDIVVLAVKPQVMADVVDPLSDTLSDDTVVISIAAGIKLSFFTDKLRKKKIVRLMPNTPCLVGEMAGGYAYNKHVSDADLLNVRKILDSCGVAFAMDEKLLDAVTGLSGSGPAFVARLIEWYASAGVREGLAPDVAYRLALKTFVGTGRLLEEQGLTPDELVRMVSSPNGTTLAGRTVLEGSEVAEVLRQTVSKAAERSRELGK